MIQKEPDAPNVIFNIIKNAYQFHKSSYESIKIKILSDSILVWSKSDHQIAFWNLINVVELLRGSFLKSGLLVRGGISIGDNFIHNDIIVSPALAEAYQLEQKANFPRILISENAVKIGLSKLIQNQWQFGIIHEGHFRICNKKMISQDFDNQYTLFPFLSSHGVECLLTGIPSFHCPGDAPLTEDQIKAIKESGIQSLREGRDNILKSRPAEIECQKVKDKHNYVASKFNDFLKKAKIENVISNIPNL